MYRTPRALVHPLSESTAMALCGCLVFYFVAKIATCYRYNTDIVSLFSRQFAISFFTFFFGEKQCAIVKTSDILQKDCVISGVMKLQSSHRMNEYFFFFLRNAKLLLWLRVQREIIVLCWHHVIFEHLCLEIFHLHWLQIIFSVTYTNKMCMSRIAEVLQSVYHTIYFTRKNGIRVISEIIHFSFSSSLSFYFFFNPIRIL